jgi:hypothetical protein
VLSYAELAPYFATRVQALQAAIAAGELDGRALDEHLLLELHRRICADLIPDIAGRWRTSDVAVGDHAPPAYPFVPQRMREYALDLQARLSALPEKPDDLWLEALAFRRRQAAQHPPLRRFQRARHPRVHRSAHPGPQAARRGPDSRSGSGDGAVPTATTGGR